MKKRISCWMIKTGHVYISNDDDDAGFPYRTWATEKSVQRVMDRLSWYKDARIIRVSITIETHEEGTK